MNIGITLGVSEAIASTGSNEIGVIPIWLSFDQKGVRHNIECQVWEYKGDPTLVPITLNYKPVDLRAYAGCCHSFQYRIEEMADGEWDNFELIEADESACPSGLLSCVPDELRAGAATSVTNWLTTIYPALINGEDA